jgi:hypothetical protein
MEPTPRAASTHPGSALITSLSALVMDASASRAALTPIAHASSSLSGAPPASRARETRAGRATHRRVGGGEQRGGLGGSVDLSSVREEKRRRR